MSYFPGGGGGATALSVNAITSSGQSLTLAFQVGARETSYAITLMQNCSIIIGGAGASLDQIMTIDLIQGGSGGNAPSFSNVSWAGGIAPSFNVAGTKRDTIQVRGVGNDLMGYPVSMGRVPIVQALPGAPTSIAVVPGNGQNTVSVPLVSASPSVSGFNVYAGSSSGGEGSSPIAGNVALPYVDANLPNGVARYYRVAAVNALGVGALSPEGAGTPSISAVPGFPSVPTITPGVGQNTITVPAVAASPTVTGYTIYRGTVAGGQSNTPIAVNVTLPYVDAGLNATTYYYTVAAVNAVGTGPSSPEASGTPSSTAASHFATFSGPNQAIFTSPSASFAPGSSAFDLRARIRMSSWSTGGSVETNLWGCWDGVTAANRLWRLGLTTDGRIRVSWAASSTIFPTATSGIVIGAAGGTDLWLRAVITPVAGSVSFYTSGDGNSWAALGAGQTATGSGAVYLPASLPYLVIGQNASGGTAVTQEQFIGRFLEAQLLIDGTLVTNPVMGPSATTDSKGFNYGTSSGVVYS